MYDRIFKNLKTTTIGILTIVFGIYTLVVLKESAQASIFLTSGTTLLMAKDN